MKAKVVHIVTRLDFGGAQQNTLYTVGHLDPERFETVLIAGPGGMLDSKTRELEGRVKVRFIEDLVREVSPLRDMIALFTLARVLREENPAVVHTHSSKAGILGRFAAALAGVPLVLHTFHGFGFHDRQNPFVKDLFVFLERIAARLTTRMIFVSKANVEYAAQHGLVREEDAVLIRSGVALAGLPAPIRGKKETRAAAGLRRDPPLVLSVGNLKPQKNPDDFLKVAQFVVEKSPQTCFAFVGDGPARARLEARVVAKGLSRNVRFLGWREDARELMAASDVFLLTSLWEGLPRALVEAMKSGLPPACYAVDGVRDLIRDGLNGFSVRPGDWRTLAERVLSLVEDKTLRERMGREAAAAVGEEFDIDAMVRRQETLLTALLEGRAGPSLTGVEP